jgi:transposase
MAMLADEVDVVVGVDTHRDTHSLGALAATSGAVVFETRVEACGAGYARALAEVEAKAPGRRAWAVEGTGAYGAGLTRFLAARGERIIEIDRPGAPARRSRAERLPGRRSGRPRGPLAHHPRHAPRRRVARGSAGLDGGARGRGERPPAGPAAAEGPHRHGARWPARAAAPAGRYDPPAPLRQAAGSHRRRSGARGHRERPARPGPPSARATDEAAQHERDIAACVRALCPKLLAEPGVGSICAA